MTDLIHPTAVIEDGAQIASTAKIGAYCVIGANVTLGENCEVVSHVSIAGKTSIGAGTKIFPFASIGHAPQDLKFSGENSELIIGENNTIREHVTMNPGTQDGGMITKVGDNGLFMVGSHVAHDCKVGNNVIMANNATIAGHVQIGDFAIIGGLSAVHQFVRIGEHSIIGGFSGVENDVIPYGRVKGERAFLAGLNLVGLERRGFNKTQLKNMQKAFKQLFYGDDTMDERLESVSNDFANDDTVKRIVEFAKAKTKFPLCQPARH